MSYTIGELIKELQKYDEDTTIKVEGKCDNMFDIECVGYSSIELKRFSGVFTDEEVYLVLD